MVDSSVGGKTGVDTPQGKNLVGAFHPPAAVLADPAVLATLPLHHYRGGLAEMAKHGVVADAAYWAELQAAAPALAARSPEILTSLIRRSVEIKAAVVTEDEREAGRRSVLNAGHTVAHAIEQLSRFAVSHGDAVAIGLVAEAHLAESIGVATAGLAGGNQSRAPHARAADPRSRRPRGDCPARRDAAGQETLQHPSPIRSSAARLASWRATTHSWTIPIADAAAIVHALRIAGAA